jgi:hypothetical protein
MMAGREGVLIVAALLVLPSPLVEAQNCTRHGPTVTCDDGRSGTFTGDAIVWPDGTKSSAARHSTVIIGDPSSVIVGPGVFVGNGRGGMVPLDNPHSPSKQRCAVLDGVSYCF